jgi:hypothetical protein
MQADLVDERDISWEVDRPEFRVLLYDPALDQATPNTMFSTAMYRLTGCSASQAVTWAHDQHSGGFVVYVIVQSDDRIGAIRLEGTDPWQAQAAQ